MTDKRNPNSLFCHIFRSTQSATFAHHSLFVRYLIRAANIYRLAFKRPVLLKALKPVRNSYFDIYGFQRRSPYIQNDQQRNEYKVKNLGAKKWAAVRVALPPLF